MSWWDRHLPFIANIKKNGFTLRQFSISFLFIVLIVAGFQFWQVRRIMEGQSNELEQNVRSDLAIANLLANSMSDGVRDLFMSLVTRKDIYSTEEQENVTRQLNIIQKNNVLIEELYSMQENGIVCASNDAWFAVNEEPSIYETIETAKKMPDVIQYSEPYYSHMVAGYSVCAAMSFDNGKRLVAAELNLNYLYMNFVSLLGGKGRTFWVASQNGFPFLFDRNQDKMLLQQAIYPLQLKEAISGIMDNCILNKAVPVPQNEGYQCMFTDENDLHWRIYAIYRPDILQEGLNKLLQELYFSTLVISLVLGTILLVVCFGITKPLRDLVRTMEEVKKVSDLKTIKSDRKDEIGRLQESYNRLVIRIHNLMDELKATEKKKQSYEIKMLQDQIRPHFLHNTLFCMYCLIQQGNGEQAAEGLKALLGLLAYSFQETDEMATISKELEMLKEYICIQTLRYGEIFRFEIRADSSALSYLIPRLTIQPILENAIFHGVLSRDDEKGVILVRVSRDEKKICIRVCDNGPGIPAEQLQSILNGNVESSKRHLSGIGIKNVHERIRLLYGDEYGIRLFSHEGRGTMVTITIPQITGIVS